MTTDLLGAEKATRSSLAGLKHWRFFQVIRSVYSLAFLTCFVCFGLFFVGCESASMPHSNQVILENDGGFRVLPDPVDSSFGTDSGDADPNDPQPPVDGGFFQEDAGSSSWDSGGIFEPSFTQLTLISVTPSRGSVSGGVRVGLAGTGFFRSFTDSGATAAKGSTEVFIGTQRATDFTIVNDMAMEVVVPPSDVTGPVDVVIKNPSGEARCIECFAFYRPLTLDGITPPSGKLSGGEWIRLSGAGLREETQVFFGKSPASQVVASGDQENAILVFTPEGASIGPVDVEAFGAGGSAVLPRAFTYEPLEALTALSPRFLPLAGGNVVLRGTSLASAIALRLGDEVVQFTPMSNEEIHFVAPPQSSPTCASLALEFASGAWTFLSHDLCWTDDSEESPTILAGLIPTHGASRGGDKITLLGSGLSKVDRLQVAGEEVSSAAFFSASQNTIEFPLPQGQPGCVSDIVALDEDGSEIARLAEAVFYEPEVSSVSHQKGKAGDEVSIFGRGFLLGGDFSLWFGPQASDRVTRLSDSQLLAVVPQGRGTVDLKVQTLLKTSEGKRATFSSSQALSRAFTYEADLSVLTLTPASGTIAGGDNVTIFGTGFGPKTTFRLGQGLLKDLNIVDECHATGRIPPGQSGYADVVALDGDKRAELFGGYFYRPSASSSVGGSSGPTILGTLNVTASTSSNSAPLEGVTVSAFVSRGSESSNTGSLVARGITDAEGMVTLQSSAMNRPVQVVFQKEGFRTLEVVGQSSGNLSVFLTQIASPGSNATSSSGNLTSGGINVTSGQVEEPVAELPSESTAAGGGTSPPTFDVGSEIAVISGTVSGFKVTRELLPEEIPMAKVSVAPTSFYSTPPFSSSTSDLVRDLLGERWKVTSDGGPFTIYGRDGLQTVYAIFGIYNVQTGDFSPSLMGMVRNVSSLPTSPATNVNIVLDVHLNASVDVQILEQVHSSQPAIPPTLSAYGWVSLGNDGYIPLASTSGMEGLTLEKIPELSLGNFLFLGRSESGDGAANSVCFHRTQGPLSQGVFLGPMVAKNRALPPNEEQSIVVTGENDGAQALRVYPFDGTLRWQHVEGTPGDIQRLFVRVTHGKTGKVEQVEAILPGIQTALELTHLLTEPIDASQDEIYVDFTTSRAPAFDYDFWGYTHFNTSSLVCWAEGFFRPMLREVIFQDELEEPAEGEAGQGDAEP